MVADKKAAADRRQSMLDGIKEQRRGSEMTGGPTGSLLQAQKTQKLIEEQFDNIEKEVEIRCEHALKQLHKEN